MPIFKKKLVSYSQERAAEKGIHIPQQNKNFLFIISALQITLVAKIILEFCATLFFVYTSGKNPPNLIKKKLNKRNINTLLVS